jgi:MoaA/NifB/PqqE/SkfB family radical SAM enzyme
MISYKYHHRLEVIFDIDGVTQEQHAKYRVGTELDKVLTHMKAFTESGSTAKCFTIVFEHNQDDVEKIGELAKANGASAMYIQPSNRFDKNPEQFRYIQEGKIRHLKPPTKYTEFKAIGL